MGMDEGSTHFSRRTLLRLALATPFVPGIVAAPTSLTAAAAEVVVGPHVRQIRLRPEMLEPVERQRHRYETLDAAPGHAEPAGARILSTGSIDAEPFRLAALTWTGARPANAAILVRTLNRAGHWSGWARLFDDGHAPESGTSEARRARRGTDPVIVDESGAVEVRIETPDGALPDDLRLELIHPGNSQSASTHGLGLFGITSAAPTIRRRSDWGADESLRESGDPRYGQVRGAFVHHTAGSNSYSVEDVPGIIRSIYAYHVEGRGWRDIGYNFLVDKFGRIWEGRYGGVERPVVGAHVAGYNYYAFGASVLGTHVNTEPEPEVLQAFAELIAWKFAVHDVDPTAVWYPGLTDVPAIAGHRDGGATQCPGDRLYAKLSVVRGRVARLLRAQR